MPECPDCNRVFFGRRCPSCRWEPTLKIAPPAPVVPRWQTLSGPPLTKEQNLQCKAIFDAVLAGEMGRVEGVYKIAALAEEWGMPIPDDELPLTEADRHP